MTADEDDGYVHPSVPHQLLQLQSINLGELQVEDETRRDVAGRVLEKF